MSFERKTICRCDGCGTEVDAKTITYGKHGNKNAPNKWIRVKWGGANGYKDHLHFHSYGCLSTWAAKKEAAQSKKKTPAKKKKTAAARKGGK